MTAQYAAEALRDAVAAGSQRDLADLYAERAILDANIQGGRHLIRGPAAIAAWLASWGGGPAELVEWATAVHAAGFELWAERTTAAGALRTREYAWVEIGRITRHWIYAAPPRTAPVGQSGEDAVRLDPRLLADLGKVVEHEPWISRGWSGNILERLALADGTRLVAKRIVPGANWIDRHTADEGREALLFRSGVLDRVRGSIDHAVVAAEPDGEAWWVVMKDVSDSLLSDNHRLSREESSRMLLAANQMWEEFWGEEIPHLCRLRNRLCLLSPAIAESERFGLDLLPKQLEVFWEAFAEAVDPDVAEGVLSLHDHPEPLVVAVDTMGTTLIHGDMRDEQLGLTAESLVLLDWGAATQGHPIVDFAWSMCHNRWRTDATHDELVEDFRRVRGEHDDPKANELIGLLGLLMYGWVFGHSAAYHPNPAERDWAREELAWWVPQARRGLEAIRAG